MEYAELNVYEQIGGKKVVQTEINEEMSETDVKVLKKYRKRVIEQRNRIRELEEEVRVLKEKLAKK
tara:strand:- start:580 stop:777 length:198 start_codon:yes stop_codon:yes gene_type:complete